MGVKGSIRKCYILIIDRLKLCSFITANTHISITCYLIMMSGEWCFFLMTVKISLGSGTKLASYCLHMSHEHGEYLFGNRWHQSVVRTKKWHTKCNRVHRQCSYHIWTSSVIHHWRDALQQGFYTYILMANTHT